MNSVKIKGLNVTCCRQEGSIVTVDEVGNYAPSIKLPYEIQVDMIRLLNPGIEFTVAKRGVKS